MRNICISRGYLLQQSNTRSIFESMGVNGRVIMNFIINTTKINTTKKLAKGSIRLQRGLFLTQQEWQDKKDKHVAKLARVSHKWYPEKY